MNLLLCLFLIVVAANDVDRSKYNVIQIGNTTVHVPKIKSERVKDLVVNNPSLVVMRGAAFLNEIDECRTLYPKMNVTEFYRLLYCSLLKEQYTVIDGNPCNLTQSLAKMLENSLPDFVVFKDFINTPAVCDQNSSNTKRRSMDADLLRDSEINKEELKLPGKSHIYLGPTRFAITTLTARILFQMDIRDPTEKPQNVNNARQKKKLKLKFIEK